MIDTKKKTEKAVLIAVCEGQQSLDTTKEHLDELEFLARTLGIKSVKQFIQRLDRPDIRTFTGKGKLDEIKSFIEQNKIDVAIYDEELSPSQLRNLEKALNIKIYDRSLLILDIFLKRAKTARAKLQVETARYQYLLPRLTRMWTHLERQRGGTATRGGSGEKEIETDRRAVRDRISTLKKKLDKLDRQSEMRRKSRSNIVRVSLVGYTNVGKSTLMNLLSKDTVFAENKLFATVDSTVRRTVINDIPFLLTDTVGFIRKLPHSLIESFKSTLDEIREADILLHVTDVSHSARDEHMEVVNQTLSEIGAGDKPTITVFNKVDLYQFDEEHISESGLDPIAELKKSYFNRENDKQAVFISAASGENLDELKQLLAELIKKEHLKIYPNYVIRS